MLFQSEQKLRVDYPAEPTHNSVLVSRSEAHQTTIRPGHRGRRHSRSLFVWMPEKATKRGQIQENPDDDRPYRSWGRANVKQ